MDNDVLTQIRFEAKVIYWRGPSPFFYAPIPASHVEALRTAARIVTYGWGMIPVEARIGEVAFATSLFPKDETYLLPLKTVARRAANITAGDTIDVELTIRPPRRARGPSPL
jgi:hypothetical protein